MLPLFYALVNDFLSYLRKIIESQSKFYGISLFGAEKQGKGIRLYGKTKTQRTKKRDDYVSFFVESLPLGVMRG